MYRAFLSGNAEVDPSLDWYKNELGFFDFYVIPLATKLKECAAFGVTSEEYLMYAILNRREFELKGKEIVANYLSVYDDDDVDSHKSFGGDDDDDVHPISSDYESSDGYKEDVHLFSSDYESSDGYRSSDGHKDDEDDDNDSAIIEV